MTDSPHLSRRVLPVLVIILLGLLAYSNTLRSPFVFDDSTNITGNLLIQNPSLFMEPLHFCSQVTPGTDASVGCDSYKSRFIGYLSFAINHKIGGLNVTGYHITNIAIHMINALLVYFLVLLTFRTPRLREVATEGFGSTLALFTALLFACHPIQTQAVTYIVQRYASLATLFSLLSLVLYIKWRLKFNEGQSKPATWLFYLLSVVSAVCAMKTKEMAFTLPLVISLYEFIFFEGKRLKRAIFLLPLLLTMLIIPLTLIGIQKPLGEVIGDVTEVTKLQTDMSRWDYLLTQFTVITTYLRLIVVPTGQNLDHDYPLYRSFFEPRVLLSFLLLLSIFGLGIYSLYRSRHKEEQKVISGPSAPCLSPFAVSSLRLVAFGIFWFFITLSVESGIIPIQDVIFEHRMYLPSVGLFLAIISGVFIIGERFGAARKVVPVVLCLVVVVFAATTYARNRVWQDDVTLWSDVVAKSPNKARAYNNLGIGYQKRKEMDKAMEMYRKATTLRPPFIDAYYNLGFTYFSFNQQDRAYYNIGIYYALKGRYEDALANYTKALTANPGFAEAYNSRGLLYASAGRYGEALSDYAKAIAADPGSAPPHNNRGVLYAGNGQLAEALEDLDRAIALDPGYANAYYNRGVVLVRSARIDRAASDFREACRLGDKEGCKALKGAASVL